MNHNNHKHDGSRFGFIVKMFICLLLVAGIFYMKYTSDEQKAFSPSATPNMEDVEIAVPDTSITPGVLPVTTDSIVPSVLPDTVLGKDKRDPYEAGYEDGYLTGCDDGSEDHMKATYDESNSFRSTHEQKEYVRGYQEGYAEGFNDGKNEKQFKI